MQYRRVRVAGGTYFFTVVTHHRQPIFHQPEAIQLLRESLRYVQHNHPFVIDAAVILPDHLHCIWTLPPDDSNFSTRWRLIKSYFSRKYSSLTDSKILRNCPQKVVWQNRFWEHFIRDQNDYNNHLNYIHYNPVKHQLVATPKDWPFSSFHRYVNQGLYSSEWGDRPPNLTIDFNAIECLSDIDA